MVFRILQDKQTTMAEQEVIKHTKKVYKVWNNKQHTVWDKVKETFAEILIIVFAITISIWFHNRSEHSHQQKDVKDFLLGLKEDMGSDIREMKEDKESYEAQSKLFNYISSRKLHDSLHVDTIHKYYKYIFNATAPNFNSGRYEGFKSSGKIGTIENKEIQNRIMDIYQEDMYTLELSTSLYKQNKVRLMDYVLENRVRYTDSTDNIIPLLLTEKAHNYCSALDDVTQIISRYDNCIDKMAKLVAAIDKEYNIN
jgi:RNase H-fold protein (predicted Holliday junction resolvase)